MVFGWAQIVMDIQPLFVLLTGVGNLHGFSHTFIGATLLAVLSALSGKYLSETVLKVLGIPNAGRPIIIRWPIAFLSAFIGTYSHVILDSMMHGDIEPYYPFALDNGFLGLITISQIHQVSVYCGAVGALLFFAIHYFRR